MAGHQKGRRKAATKRREATAKPSAPSPELVPVESSSGPLVVSRPQAVRLVSVSDRTFARLESEGILVALRPGTGRRPSVYDAYTLVPAYLGHRQQQLQGSVDSPRDRKDLSIAQLNELRLAKEKRYLLPRDEVVRDGQAFVKATVAKLRAIPSRLVRAGAIAPAAAGVVTELVREAQEEMSRWSNHLDLLTAVDEESA